jgi:glycerol-3-phosphate dehydrogenase
LIKNIFPEHRALMIPKTTDGRVLFAVPWYHRVVVGTTDTPVEKASIEPVALKQEIDFIIQNVNQYLKVDISEKRCAGRVYRTAAVGNTRKLQKQLLCYQGIILY